MIQWYLLENGLLALVGAGQVKRAHSRIGDSLDHVSRLDHVFLVVRTLDIHLDARHKLSLEFMALYEELQSAAKVKSGKKVA